MLAVTRVDRDGGIQNPPSQEFASIAGIVYNLDVVTIAQHSRYVVPENSDQGS